MIILNIWALEQPKMWKCWISAAQKGPNIQNVPRQVNTVREHQSPDLKLSRVEYYSIYV